LSNGNFIKLSKTNKKTSQVMELDVTKLLSSLLQQQIQLTVIAQFVSVQASWSQHSWNSLFGGWCTLVYSATFCCLSICPRQVAALWLLWAATLLRGSISKPLRQPLPQTGGSQPPIFALQTAAKASATL